MTGLKADIAIIGAGIVGLCCAERLSRSSYSVMLIDPVPSGRMASWGNMGAMAFGEIVPMARPATIAQALRWMADPLGPVTVSTGALLRNSGWFMRFGAAAFDKSFRARVEALTQLNGLAESAWEEVLVGTALWDRCVAGRVQHVYDRRESFLKDAALWAIRERAGHEHRELSPSECAESGILLPADGVAIDTPSWRLTPDPYVLSRQLEQIILTRGVEVMADEVANMEPQGERIVLRCRRGEIVCRTVVVAAGVRSRWFAKAIGDTAPLIAERGYSYTVPRHDHGIEKYTVFRNHGFVVSPLECGLRIGGSAEFVSPEARPNWHRLDVLLKKANSFLSDLDCSGGRRWYGDRPSTPDSLPIIGRSSKHRNVFYAVGHGHLGVTQAAATGQLVSNLIEGVAPAIETQPFSPARFR
jgi:D-amino-acid dehydrogenase